MTENDVVARGLFVPFIAVSLSFGATTTAQAQSLDSGTTTYVSTGTELGVGTVAGNGGAIEASAASVSVSNDFQLNTGMTVSGANDLTLSGAISGVGSLTKTGDGNLTLWGSNSYIGNTNLNGGKITVVGPNAFGSGVIIGNGGSIEAGVASVTMIRAITLNSNLGVSGSNNLMLGGPITGAGSLTKTGNGNLTLFGSSTYSGGTTINGGKVTVASNSALGTGTITASGGTIEAGIYEISLNNNIQINSAGLGVSGSDNLTLSGVIAGTGAITKTGSGTLTLNAANTFSGGLNLAAGTVVVSSSAALGSGAVSVTGASTLNLGLGASVYNNVNLLGANLTVSSTATSSLSGVISGSGSLTKAGSGTLRLTGANTYTGGTTIDAGRLELGAGGSLNATGAVHINAGTVLDLTAASSQTIGALSGVAGSYITLGANTLTFGSGGDQTFAGSISGTGGIVKQGSGTQTLSDTNTYTGGTTINGGTLALGAGGSLAATGAVNLGASGATFDISGAGASQTIGALSGVAGSYITLGANTLTFGSAASQTFAGTIGGTGAIVKQGSGTQTLTGANTYAGGTTINGGTLALGAGGSLAAIGAVNLGASGATFDISGAGANQTIGGLSGVAGSNISLGTNTLTFGDSSNQTFSGTIGGTGGIVKQGSGTQTLSGANTYTGGTTINGGTLTLGGGGSLASTGALNLATVGTGFDISNAGNQTIGGLSGTNATTVNLGAYTLTFGGADTNIYNGVFSGTGNIIKQGSGTQVLGGASTFSGSTTVAAGTLELSGASSSGDTTVKSGATLSGTGAVGSLLVENGGRLALGNATVPTAGLNVYRDLILAAGSTYAFDFSGNGDSDGISVGGIAYLRGGLSITALDAATSYQNGQVYTLLTATGGVDGTFNPVTNNSAFLNYNVQHNANDVQMVITLAGDSDSLFSEKANTPNQISVAHALDTLDQSGTSLALYNALLPLSGDEARTAYDELAGVSHATGQAGMVNSANMLNNVITNRMRSASNGVASTPSPITPLGYAEEKRPARENDPFATYSTTAKADEFDHGRFSVWGTGLGSWGKVDGVFGGADTDTRTSGLLFGADGMVSDQWRVGAFGGYSYSSFDTGADDLRSRNYHAGLYANSQWGELAFRSGINYTYHDVDTTRVLSVLNQRLSGDYSANTVSAFGELGYRFDLGSAALEPFAGISHTWNRTGSFTETGGSAALSVDGRSMNSTATTLGLRASSDFDLDGTLVTARGTIGWVHAFGDVDPVSTARFASGDAFSVSGTPIDRNAALLELGLDVVLTPNATLGLGYNGQIGANATDHAFNAGLKVRF